MKEAIKQVGSILPTVLSNVVNNYAALLRAILIPMAVVLFLGFIASTVSMTLSLLYGISLLYLLAYSSMILSFHRVLILGSNAVSKWGINGISKREFQFFLYVLCLFVMFYLMGFLLLIPKYGLPLLFILKVVLTFRIILVFPAISVDRYWSFFRSWKETKAHQVFMLFVVITVVFIREVAKGLSEYLTPIASMLGLMVEGLVWVFIAGLLSEAFKLIELKNK